MHITDENLLITGNHFVMIPIDSSVTLTEVFKDYNQVRVKSRVYRNLVLKFANGNLKEEFCNILEKKIFIFDFWMRFENNPRFLKTQNWSLNFTCSLYLFSSILSNKLRAT